MLWSLVKILLFVALIAALAVGAMFLNTTDWGLTVAAAGYEADLGPVQAAIAILVFAALVWLLFKLIGFLLALGHFLNGDETAISRWASRSRERKGFEALSDAMMALAAGEGREALAKARRADSYLDRPELTGLLTAQAAEMAGDRARAEETYKALVRDERTRFVGISGVMRQKLADGDHATAKKLAEKAFALRPRNEAVQDTLLRLQTQDAEWAAARETLRAKLKHGSLPRDVHRRRDAILALADAGPTVDENSTVEAREAAIEANRLAPDLVPAAAAAARALIAQNKPKTASRVLRAAWGHKPHPELAAAFAAIEPKETPAQRLKRFEVLTKQNPDHPETRMLLAELLIAAEDFPGARRAMGDLAAAHPTTRTLTLMAAIEQGEGGDESVVRAWLARAVSAPRGEQWVCKVCHSVHSDWRPVCTVCSAFDSFEWTEPPAPAVDAPTAMLPAIVGTPRGADSAEGEEARDILLARPAEPRGDAPGDDAPLDGEVLDGPEGRRPGVPATESEVDNPPPTEPANPAPGATTTEPPRAAGRP